MGRMFCSRVCSGVMGRMFCSRVCSGLRVELHRGPSRCGVSGPQSGGAEEEIRLQMPPTEGERHRAGLSGQRHLLPRRTQHLCHR